MLTRLVSFDLSDLSDQSDLSDFIQLSFPPEIPVVVVYTQSYGLG